MSHPLIVEAIETEFHPVLVYNNREGDDARLLERFGEPAWNNPVIRYLDARGNDLIPRKDDIWSVEGTARRLTAALRAAGRTVPDYLDWIGRSGETETAEFAMHCYWEGEAKLGSLPGVLATRAGWRDKLEVVRLEFDPKVVDYRKLLDTAQSFECASKVFALSDEQLSLARDLVGADAVRVADPMREAKDSDQLYYLRNSNLRHLPLTPFQATKVNGALGLKQPVEPWLSPRQRKLLETIESLPDATAAKLDPLMFPEDEDELGSYARKLDEFLQAATAK